MVWKPLHLCRESKSFCCRRVTIIIYAACLDDDYFCKSGLPCIFSVTIFTYLICIAPWIFLMTTFSYLICVVPSNFLDYFLIFDLCSIVHHSGDYFLIFHFCRTVLSFGWLRSHIWFAYYCVIFSMTTCSYLISITPLFSAATYLCWVVPSFHYYLYNFSFLVGLCRQFDPTFIISIF